MKVLNLTNLETSEIKYEVSKFPDGQQQVKIIDFKENYHHYKGYGEYVNAFHPVQIKSRLNNFKDLELIICAVVSLRNLGVKEIHLYVPFFLGSRSDRQFEEGSNNYLKQVICPIINSLKLDSITVLDPHSDVLEACLNNFKKVDNLSLIKSSIRGIYDDCTKEISPDGEGKFILISPDAGANKKIFKIAEQIGYTGDVITCSKSRDEQGHLSKTEVPITREHLNKDLIIIDDICDGGATFINIAKEIRNKQNEFKMLGYQYNNTYLIVTHGIFSKGFKELNQYFDGIYCTNSYRDVADNEYNEVTNVKQLNIF